MKRLSALLITAGILVAAYPAARYAYAWYWQQRLFNAWEKNMLRRNPAQDNWIKEAANETTSPFAKLYSDPDDTQDAINNRTDKHVNTGVAEKANGIPGAEDITGKKRKNIDRQGKIADETDEAVGTSYEPVRTSIELKGRTAKLAGTSEEPEWTTDEPTGTLEESERTSDEHGGTSDGSERTSEQLQEPSPENKAALKNMLGILEIAKIKVRLPILDGTSEDNLRIGAGKLEGTAPIGEIGNTVISAHRSHTYGWLFNRLNELEIGDEIKITTAENTYSYIVFDIKVVEPSDNSVLAQSDNDRLLTLTTCDPLYTASHRLIVQARME